MLDDIAWAVRTVLRSGQRRRFLFADGTATVSHLLHFLRRIVPHTRAILHELRAAAEQIPDDALREQALASIDHKGYHVAGAAIFATFLPRDAATAYVRAVVPLETIYDYLDNVCDRHAQRDPAFFATVHEAIADALAIAGEPQAYYRDGPAGDDGGYLRMLVLRAREAINALGVADETRADFAQAAALYGQMQTVTHLPRAQRGIATTAWFDDHRALAQSLDWHEFAAAAGSQFQIYAPLFEAAAGRPQSAHDAFGVHFPLIAALHVLLDSFIDQSEDAEHGDLNLVAVYGNPAAFRKRAAALFTEASTAAESLPDPYPHRFALRIMVLFYLSHPKVYRQGLDEQATRLLRACVGAPS